MPCYQMNLVSVEFKAANEAILIKALEALNIAYQYDKNLNIISIQGIVIDLAKQNVETTRSGFETVNQIKRQYSQEVITEVAKKKRWIMKQQANKIQLKKY